MAVILAAGEGVRMGAPKALLEYAPGESFLSHVARLFAAAGCEVLAVLGHEAARIEAGHPDVRAIRNERWREGQLSSARLGITRALETGTTLILVHPVDMPTIAPATVEMLLSRPTEQRAAVPVFRGSPGHPLLLPAGCAKAILRESAATLEAAVSSVGTDELPVDDPGVTLNVNTAEDYQRAFGRPPRLAGGGWRPPAP